MNFNGQLNSNEIFGAIYNMIISQQVFADNISGTFSDLVDSARVDGSLYGDTKLFYSTDVLNSKEWNNDDDGKNLLSTHRPASPKVQKITIDQFRQISLTLDEYLSKRAFSEEGAFSNFNSVMSGWIRDTKRVYDSTLYNTFIGTEVSKIGKQFQEVDLSTITATGEEKNRLEAETIAQKLADIFIDLKDVSRDYNDLGCLRSYSPDKLKVVWSAKWINKIEKRDLPTIFHKDGLVDKFDQHTLPSRYFGTLATADGTAPTNNTKVRSTIEKDYNTVKCDASGYDPKKHVFAGDLLPSGASYKAYEAYTEDDNVICKIISTDSVPYMSAFEVGTSFFNPQALYTNHYLTFGYNTLQHINDRPFITVSAK